MLSQDITLWNSLSAVVPLAAPLAPNIVSGYGVGVGAGTVVSGSVTCTPNGGTPPYSYLWSFVSGDNEIQVTSANSPTTTFYKSTPPFIFAYLAEWKCTVTDSLAATVDSNHVEVQIERN